MHVHVTGVDGEARFWLEPEIELSKNYRLSRVRVKQIESILEARYDELRLAWERHFSG